MACILHPAIIAGLFSVSLSLIAAADISQLAAQISPSAPATAERLQDNQFTILVTTIAGFLSTLVALIFQIWRESRNRKWDLENRKLAREESANKIEELKNLARAEAELTRARAARVETALTARVEAHDAKVANMQAKLDEHTRLSLEALSHAKDANAKMSKIGEIIDSAKLLRRRLSDDPPPEPRDGA